LAYFNIALYLTRCVYSLEWFLLPQSDSQIVHAQPILLSSTYFATSLRHMSKHKFCCICNKSICTANCALILTVCKYRCACTAHMYVAGECSLEVQPLNNAKQCATSVPVTAARNSKAASSCIQLMYDLQVHPQHQLWTDIMTRQSKDTQSGKGNLSCQRAAKYITI